MDGKGAGMDKVKRVIALVGVVLLVGMYVMTIISAVFATKVSHGWFAASIATTVLVPVFLYAVNLVVRLSGKKDEREKEDKEQIDGNAGL